MTFSVEMIDTIAEMSSTDWNSVSGIRYPFLRYEFLCALEQSGSVAIATGWRPKHVIVRAGDGEMVAVMPCYLKDHSYGEYVFDWSWADAYHRHGLEYYPKLLTAIPFTPCVGSRLAVKSAFQGEAIHSLIERYIIGYCQKNNLSSWHLLFPDKKTLDNTEMQCRTGVQFHWYNRDYSSFDNYLGAMTSRKRKSIRKEREKVKAQGIQFRWIEGHEIEEECLQRFYVFYHATYMKRGRKGYLTMAFFEQLLKTMPENLFLVMAYQQDTPVASALFFKDDETLYGRYWGCVEEFDQLHFETCYYQGIEYCIAHGLEHFDSGAQGEHKIQRGFEPIETHSWHWIAHPEFRQAIGGFLEEERNQVGAYQKEAEKLLPFRCD